MVELGGVVDPGHARTDALRELYRKRPRTTPGAIDQHPMPSRDAIDALQRDRPGLRKRQPPSHLSRVPPGDALARRDEQVIGRLQHKPTLQHVTQRPCRTGSHRLGDGRTNPGHRRYDNRYGLSEVAKSSMYPLAPRWNTALPARPRRRRPPWRRAAGPGRTTKQTPRRDRRTSTRGDGRRPAPARSTVCPARPGRVRGSGALRWSTQTRTPPCAPPRPGSPASTRDPANPR